MPLLKIWSCDRKVKKMVAVKTVTYQDVFRKAIEKLDYAQDGQYRFVLESDGTEVDEEAIVELGSENLILLRSSEEWRPACDPASVSAVSVSTGSDENLVPISPHVEEKDVAVPTVSTHQSSSRSASKEKLSLPEFSSYVKACLRGGDSGKAWTKVVEELAYFYLDVVSDHPVTSQSQYLDIGRQMIQMYPCLKRTGSKPWSLLMKCLSQKIRTERFHRKRKSLPLNGVDQPAASVCSPKRRKSVALAEVSLSSNTPVLSEEEYRTHVAELRSLAEAKQPSMPHARTLLKETFEMRRKWLKSLNTAAVNQIVQEYPCFQQGKFLWEEFKLVKELDDEQLSALGTKIESLLARIVGLMPRAPKGDLAMLDVIHFVELQTGLLKGKGKKTMSVIEVLTDVADTDVDQYLKSPAGQGPQLRVFVRSGHFDFAVVVADGIQIESQAPDIIQALLLLMACYYVFDLDYPRPYSQILGFFQQFALDELYTGVKSAKFSHFAARLQ